jgi:probable rRNA maturation factor
MRAQGRPVCVANRHPGLSADRRGLARALGILDLHGARFRGGCPPGELSVAFLTDAALAVLHARFLGDPAPTDVITFEGDPPGGAAGEICVSVDAAVRLAGRGRAALAREITLYVVHGWLHLAGYDDLAAGDRRAMRRAEARALALIARSRAFPRFKLA